MSEKNQENNAPVINAPEPIENAKPEITVKSTEGKYITLGEDF